MRWLLPLLLVVTGCSSVPVIDELTTPSFDFELVFEGNEAFDDKALTRALAFDLSEFADQEHSRAAADDAAYALQVHYRGRGYRLAEVEYEVGPGSRLTLRVDEGPRTTVDEAGIAYEGVTAFDGVEVRAFFNGPRLGTFGRGDLLFIADRVNGNLRRRQSAAPN